MPKFFDDAGTPVWLPEDYDSNEVFDLTFVETTDLEGTKWAAILIEFDDGMEIEKRFAPDEYPAAMDSWRWIKVRWNQDHDIEESA